MTWQISVTPLMAASLMMAKGPSGQKRPGDVIGAAIMVAKIATGEIEDIATPADKAHHSAGGRKGAPRGRRSSASVNAPRLRKERQRNAGALDAHPKFPHQMMQKIGV